MVRHAVHSVGADRCVVRHVLRRRVTLSWFTALQAPAPRCLRERGVHGVHSMGADRCNEVCPLSHGMLSGFTLPGPCAPPRSPLLPLVSCTVLLCNLPFFVAKRRFYSIHF